MKNKKAFTLIELIGVIVILGILMLLVFPSILNHIRKTKGELKEATKNILLNAAELYVGQNKSNYKLYNESIYCITIQELLDHHTIESDLVKNIEKNKAVEVKTHNNQTIYELTKMKSAKLTV